MTDIISKEKRSWNMSRIGPKDTKPERIVRSALHKAGFRFRLHVPLPGKPDIVLSRYKTVIFVNGCFWHSHEGCKKAAVPKSNVEFWLKKLQRNVSRQSEVKKQLAEAGWKVIVVWECEVNDISSLIPKLIKEIRGCNSS